MRTSVRSVASTASAVLMIAALLTIGVEPYQAQEDGRAAFVDAGCARCHSVAAVEIEATVSERMRGPDLGTVGDDHDAAWVVSVVKQETELEGGAHRASFRGTDEQLDALAAWLVGVE